MVCKNCRNLLARFKKYIDQRLQDNLDTALTVTNFLKTLVSSPVVSAVVAGTSTTKDDKALRIAKDALFYSAQILGIVGDIRALTIPQAVAKINAFLEGLPEPMRNAALIKIASLITKYLDGRYGENIYDTIVQARYSMLKSENQ